MTCSARASDTSSDRCRCLQPATALYHAKNRCANERSGWHNLCMNLPTVKGLVQSLNLLDIFFLYIFSLKLGAVISSDKSYLFFFFFICFGEISLVLPNQEKGAITLSWSNWTNCLNILYQPDVGKWHLNNNVASLFSLSCGVSIQGLQPSEDPLNEINELTEDPTSTDPTSTYVLLACPTHWHSILSSGKAGLQYILG